MTTLLSLRYGYAGGGSEEHWFTGGLDGFRLIDWVQNVGDNDLTEETLTVSVEGDTKELMIQNLRKLDVFIYHAEQSRLDPLHGQSVWMRSNIKDEIFGRTSNISKIRVFFNRSLNRPPTSPGNFVNEYTVVLTREPGWEHGRGPDARSTLAHNVGNYEAGYAGAPALSHIVSYGGDTQGNVGGNMPALLTRCVVAPIFAAAPALREAWLGFRTDRYGDRSLFDPVWDLGYANAGNFGTDVTLQSDGDAIKNRYLRYTGDTDATLAQRVTILLTNVTSDLFEQRGSFLVLGRFKCTGTQTYQVRLSSGVAGGKPLSNGIVHPRVAVDKTNYFLYPLGHVDFPPSAFTEEQALGEGFMKGMAMQVDAGILSAGSGNLNMDALVLVPTAEGFAYFDFSGMVLGLYHIGTDASGGEAQLESSGRVVGVGMYNFMDRHGGAPIRLSTQNWSMPLGRGSFVSYAQQANVHDLTDYWSVRCYYSPQWRTLRGYDSGYAGP